MDLEKHFIGVKNKMLAHADKYSQAFSVNATKGKYPKVSFADFEAGKVAEKICGNIVVFGIRILMEWLIKQC